MCWKAVIVPLSRETSTGSAPASSRACQGRSSSTCSTPSVTRTATFMPSSSPAMQAALPRPRPGHTRPHYGLPMARRRPLPALHRRRPGVAARFVAGPRVDDALRVAGELVRAGRRVALDHLPPRSADAAAELATLVARVAGAGLAADCELTVPLDRLGSVGARRVASTAAASGLGVCLLGPATLVDRLAAELPDVRTAVHCGDPDAEERARTLAGRAVRL